MRLKFTKHGNFSQIQRTHFFLLMIIIFYMFECLRPSCCFPGGSSFLLAAEQNKKHCQRRSELFRIDRCSRRRERFGARLSVAPAAVERGWWI